MANSLAPLVHLGKAGATAGVIDALSHALADHELVKLRFVDFKGEKRGLAGQLAVQTGAELIRIIGNVAILYRQQTDPDKRKVDI
jgi:RNA-binding protein